MTVQCLYEECMTEMMRSIVAMEIAYSSSTTSASSASTSESTAVRSNGALMVYLSDKFQNLRRSLNLQLKDLWQQSKESFHVLRHLRPDSVNARSTKCVEFAALPNGKLAQRISEELLKCLRWIHPKGCWLSFCAGS